MKFYGCRDCGNIITYQREAQLSVHCCGNAMVEMDPNTEDASLEKHKPVIEYKGKNVMVRVGELMHPMENDHHIQWVILETGRGYYKRHLQPGGDPVARFTLQDDEDVRAAYEYCNLHGLWKSKSI
ncbi:MAG: desulfoferrodoxin [Oscillospiraceae bacterium]|nr:desulfoferrodoxin [Oscillospiraceae bacterium]